MRTNISIFKLFIFRWDLGVTRNERALGVKQVNKCSVNVSESPSLCGNDVSLDLGMKETAEATGAETRSRTQASNVKMIKAPGLAGIQDGWGELLEHSMSHG